MAIQQSLYQILEYCNSKCLAVVPQGGNTSLVGGNVLIITNTLRMNSIISFNKVRRSILRLVNWYVLTVSLFIFIMPLDLVAKESYQIGGNISTNVGGLRLVYYESLHGTVLGLEVVLANGIVIDMLGTL
ncbi:hypothetical protein R6Q59_003330 [Mikania micrantha]